MTIGKVTINGVGEYFKTYLYSYLIVTGVNALISVIAQSMAIFILMMILSTTVMILFMIAEIIIVTIYVLWKVHRHRKEHSNVET